MSEQEKIRFRSFAERYVIERASGFKSDGDAWTAVQDAVRVYKMIQQQGIQVACQLEATMNAAAQQQAKQAPQANQAQAGVGQMLQSSPWAAPPSPLNPASGSSRLPGWAQANHNMMVAKAMQALAPTLSPAAKKSLIRQLFNWSGTP